MIHNRRLSGLSKSKVIGTRKSNNFDQQTYRKLYNKYILTGGGNGPSSTQDTCTEEPDSCKKESMEVQETPIAKGDVSRINTYTIPCGTVLYHGSASQQSFDPENIQLGDTTLIAFFSTSQKIAEENFAKCSKYTSDNKGGYLHRFIVTKDIDNILILSKYEIQTLDPQKLQDRFCTRGRNKYDKVLNGIGYFFPKQEEQGEDDQGTENQYDNEFALCTAQGLQHWGYKMCVGPHELAKDWIFLEGSSNEEPNCETCENEGKVEEGEEGEEGESNE